MNPFNELDSHTSYYDNHLATAAYEQGTFYHTPPIPATTQKARGIFFIMNKSSIVKAAFDWRVPKHILFGAGEQFNDDSFNFPVFIRPCPTVPRHGFVDSTYCANAEELNKISQETYDEEPDAEILVTKPVDAAYSAILTDGVLTFSGGNDGATSGNNVKYFYISEDPIAPAINLDPNIMLEGEVPFYEFVVSKTEKVNLVQVRSAPGVPKCKDFVPEEVTVETILKAEGDLLDWEKLLSTVDPKTTIIDHTDGSLASHYAIHAIINKIPIFTTHVPSIGDVVPATVHDTDITDDDREKFYRAFCYGFSSANYVKNRSKFSSNATDFMTKTMRLALSTLHNFSAIAMAKDYEVVGIVLGLFLRACLSISAGESRYGKEKVDKYGDQDLVKWRNSIPSGRSEVYSWTYKKNPEEFIDSIMTVYRIFNEIKWGSGYGGKKWAGCTRSSIELFNACVNKDIESVVKLFNNVLHEEHNGGKYLNKVIGIGDFDRAADQPSLYAMKNVHTVMDILSMAWEYVDKTDYDQIPWSKFVEIDYKKKFKKKLVHKPTGRWKVRAVKGYVNKDHKISRVEVYSDVKGVPKVFKVDGPYVSWQAAEDDDSHKVWDHEPGDWVPLESVPYNWSLDGEKKVISKAKVNFLLDGKTSKKKSKASFKSSVNLDIDMSASVNKFKMAIQESADQQIKNSSSLKANEMAFTNSWVPYSGKSTFSNDINTIIQKLKVTDKYDPGKFQKYYVEAKTAKKNKDMHSFYSALEEMYHYNYWKGHHGDK